MVIKKRFLLRDGVGGLAPYKIEDHPCAIKLDANESPFSIDWTKWPDVLDGLRKIDLNRYPDPSAGKIRSVLSDYMRWPVEKIVLGNGSDELIQYILMAFGGFNRPVYAPHPGFAMYRIISIAMGQEFRSITLEDGFELPSNKEFLEELSDVRQKIVFIASPNNPTGNCFDRERILSVIKHTNGLVCIDEAYHDFDEGIGFLDILPEFKNLVILRTLSKIGMAGLRVGILLANDYVISAISKVRLPYNLNAISQFLALAVLNHKDIILDMNQTIKKNRVWLAEKMQRIKGIKIFPSQANFILFTSEFCVEAIYKELLSEGVLIKVFPPDGKWPGFLRVTVGTEDECKIFIHMLEKVLYGLEKLLSGKVKENA
ncbi:histidinol-phosphate transaminase [bacterium]|nr:histidinol-phosphate transaminase [bacterium]